MEDSQLPYKCLKCNGKEKHDIPDCLQQNQKKLELTLQEYKHDKMLLQSQYDSKYHAIIDTMGKREKELDNALKEINVYRQAFHGNIFIGNDVKIILKKFNILCAV